MIILTGGAGFIGSVLLARLNAGGYSDILIVDELGQGEKWKNLVGKKFSGFIHKDEFLHHVPNITRGQVEAVFHLGACTSTTERNVDYLLKNNYEYSKTLARLCIGFDIPFIYASSAATYGDGKQGFSDAISSLDSFRPLNPYGYSKHIFDQWVIQEGYEKLLTGFKFFNVFGPNEYHKEGMASLIYKAFHQIRQTGRLQLFKSYDPKYRDGESVRDFIYVKDCVDVLMWAFEHPEKTGIYNLGSGKARSWNDLADSVFSAMDLPKQVDYIEMPLLIQPAYQYFTEADMTKLQSAGYEKPFTALEEAVTDYVRCYLSRENQYL